MLYSKTTRGFYDRLIHGNAIPADAVEVSDSDYATLMAGAGAGATIVPDDDGYPVLVADPKPTLENEANGLSAVVRRHLDAVAKSRGYDNIVSLCSYATSSVASFAQEGQAGLIWRDAVWQVATQVLNDVISGSRPVPSQDEMISLLPPMVWPN